MPIACDHPRPPLNLPGYVPPRLAWQVPAYIPGLGSDASRVLRDAFQGIYNELTRQGRVRNVIPLIEDMYAQPGSYIVGPGDGQIITLLPPGAEGFLDPVTVVLTDVATPVTVVSPDGSEVSLGEEGSYDFTPTTPDGGYETIPGIDLSGAYPGLSVPGRAGTTTGPVAAITASGRRQVLSTNGAGTALGFRPLGEILPGAPIYDVMAYPFNATGNGVADDTAAINAAIAAANAAPGVICLGAAHRITAALTTVSNNNVVIQGRGAFNGGTTVIVDTASAVYAFTFSAQHCKIRNLWIRGATVNLSTAVYFAGCYAAEMANVAVSQMGCALEAYCCTHTDVRYCGADDLYGPRGFYAHGAAGIAFNHAIRFEYVFCGTAFPIGTSGTADTWASGQSISVGQLRFANGAIWQAATSGTTGSTAPSGFPSSSTGTVHSTTVSDGGVSWYFAMPLNAWFCQGSFSQTFEMQDCGALQGGYGLSVEDDAPSSGSDPLFTRVHNFQVDHPYARGVRLRDGGAAEFTQLFVTSVQAGHGVEVATTYGGGYRFVGGEIFGCAQSGVLMGASNGTLVGVKITTVGDDGVSLGSSVESIAISDCTITNAGAYGVDIASGCDYFTVTGNLLSGNSSGTVRNTPGPSITRVVRDNSPDEPNHSADGYENVNLAPGTYTESETQLQLLATTHTVFINPTSNGDVIIEGFTHGASNAGKRITWIKEGSDGRVLFRDTNVGTNDIWTPGSTDYILSQYNDAAVTEQISLHRWRLIAVPRFAVRKNSTGSDFTRRRLNLIEGTGVTLTFSDDSTNEEVDITIASTIVGLTDGDKGDITVSASGATWTIDNDVVSDAKLRNSAALSVIGRSANSTGDPADIAAGTDGHVLRRSGTTLGFGTIATAGITDDAVTDAKLRDGGACSVIGRSVNSSGDTADISAASNNLVLARSSNTVAFQQVANAMIRDSAALSVIGRAGTTSGVVADITANAVSNAGHVLKVTNAGTGLDWGTVANVGLAQMNQSRIKGRSEGAGSGDPEDLTPTQVAAIIDDESFAWTAIHTFGGSYTQFTSPQTWGNIATANLSATQNNFSASSANICRFTLTGAQQLTGITPGSVSGDRLLVIMNADDTDTLTLAHEDTGSSAANRFSLPGNTVRALLPNACAFMIYDSTSSRWRMAYPL